MVVGGFGRQYFDVRRYGLTSRSNTIFSLYSSTSPNAILLDNLLVLSSIIARKPNAGNVASEVYQSVDRWFCTSEIGTSRMNSETLMLTTAAAATS